MENLLPQLNEDGSTAQESRQSFEAAADTSAGTSQGPAAATNLNIGSFNQTGNFWTGEVGEVIIWTPSLTAGERDDLEAWVTQEWGIAWA